MVGFKGLWGSRVGGVRGWWGLGGKGQGVVGVWGWLGSRGWWGSRDGWGSRGGGSISCGGGHRVMGSRGWWGQGVGVKMGKGVVEV